MTVATAAPKAGRIFNHISRYKRPRRFLRRLHCSRDCPADGPRLRSGVRGWTRAGLWSAAISHWHGHRAVRRAAGADLRARRTDGRGVHRRAGHTHHAGEHSRADSSHRVHGGDALGGVFQILCGVFRLGRYITQMPYTVISGFMSGIGTILIVLQTTPLLGQAPPPREDRHASEPAGAAARDRATGIAVGPDHSGSALVHSRSESSG